MFAVFRFILSCACIGRGIESLEKIARALFDYRTLLKKAFSRECKIKCVS